MKQYDFDPIIDRHNSDAVKIDGMKELFGKSDLIPLWVADMDFSTPDFILDALRERLNHPILGYPRVPDRYYDVLCKWVERKHAWKIKKEWLSYIPGIVKGIGMVLQCFTKPGDKVIIQPPVYHPFRIIPEENGRVIVNNPLKLTEKGYEMDFDHLESILDDDCKLLILCNPHNPAGIVWNPDTLRRLAQICAAHGIVVISDEIHSEMIHPGHRHYPFASVSEEAARISITFMAPSKTFNIAGVVSSYAVVSDPVVRKRFFSYLDANEFNYPSIFSLVATEAAYEKGEEWLGQMMEYVGDNIEFVDNFIKEHLPQLRVIRPHASFLIWLDCRALNLNREELLSLFVNKGGLALNEGASFGPGGNGFMRMNIGTSRNVLRVALEQLKKAIDER